MTAPFSIGKVFLFISANILVGLLQVWVLYGALAVLGKDHSVGVILGDGGLFFFATSLTVNAILMMFSEGSAKIGPIDVTFTLFAIVGGLVMSAVFYGVIMTSNLEAVSPFHDQVGPQVSCALLAFAYALYTSVRTGYFSK